MERMSDTLEGVDEQALHHFLSNSAWDYRSLMDDIAINVSSQIGGSPSSCLIIDESAIPKKGKCSAGVSRQYCGRLGKVDNCQVGVYSALCKGSDVSLIDSELFLPETWAKDNKRYAKAKVPKDKRKFRTKIQIALEQVKRARENGVEYSWVGADSFYGRDYNFATTLIKWGEQFVLDIPENYWIFEEDPSPGLLPSKHTGRPGTRFYSDKKPITVKQWLKKQAPGDWKWRTFRDGTKGRMRCQALHKQVWVWDGIRKGKSGRAYCWHIICRKEKDTGAIKMSISNAPKNTSTKRLLYMQGQRHFVERAFQDAKSELGMDEYQVRNWLAWHKHMSLVMLAAGFVLKEKERMRQEMPYITVADIVIAYAMSIPSKQDTVEGVMEVLEKRQRKRQLAHENLYGAQVAT